MNRQDNIIGRIIVFISLATAILIPGQAVFSQGTSKKPDATSEKPQEISEKPQEISEKPQEISEKLYGTVDAPPRDVGHLTLQAGVGSVNGARLGLQYYLSRYFSAELSAGYLSITLIKEQETRDFADAISVSAGLNYFSHSESSISPTVSILFSYIHSLEDPDEFFQQRYALTPMIGTEYYATGNFLLFFRFGPSVHYIDERTKTSIAIEAQFDAGMGLTF